MQCSGFDSPLAIAASRRGTYGTTRPGSIPHEAATTTLGLASSIRLASSSAAKPPNTTEWIAPSRAHASIAITASGTIGMYTITRSPRSTPCAARAPAKRATRSSSSRYVNVAVVSVTGES